MSGVRARFYVSSITKNAYNQGAAQVTLQAVSRGDQNKQWASATPNGQITMTINNEPAASWFEAHLGQDCDILITAVPTLLPGDGHPFRLSEITDKRVYGYGRCGDCNAPWAEHDNKGGLTEAPGTS
jgi:hypothetical protein